MKRSQLCSERVFKHDHSIFDVFYSFAIREFFFGIGTIFVKHSIILCQYTRGFSAHDNNHMNLWMWNSFEMIIPIPKESFLCTEGFI